ncbi:ABC transporter substrate-binding protein [Hyperthermus butylicus]|uniref:ABC-type Fe3+ transport system, periplasmic component, AfuA n=1 Tax=Hyperthermus butylicus (strain DSM 5456 / JCM 9403 / PLM1-5) TaxID=415426 RepID=A2BJW2_HYPBU|nr:extracellular solute-binding protein [Hyperthermus butylicus]ABM80273.1 ABC-type Fe3+ transport system, periplasmic component, AfuA [Hyperthermus butylicus DSM 5456]
MVSQRLLLTSAAIIAIMIVIAVAILYMQGGETGAQGVKLVIVTRLSPEEQQALREAFLNSSIAREYGIADVEFRKLDYAQWPSLAESGEVDGFFIGEKPVYDRLCSEGHLAPLTLDELLDIVGELDERYLGRASSSEICWVAVGQAVYGFIVNKVFLERYGLPEPRTWGDLVNPIYLRPLVEEVYMVSFPRPSKSGTARTIVHGILQKYGWERGWQLLTVIGMEAGIVDSSELARDQAAEGLVGVAPAYIGYGIEAEKQGRGAVFRVPEGEGILYISIAAVAKASKHKEQMQAFILWLLSDEGQRALARLFYYIPVRPVSGIDWVERIYSELRNNIFEYNRTLASEVDLAVTTYFEATIADPAANKLLKRIGKLLAQLYEEGKIDENGYADILAKLGSPLRIKDPWSGEEVVFTLEYAKKINSKLRSSEDRDKFYNAVKTVALEQYRSILSELEKLAG